MRVSAAVFLLWGSTVSGFTTPVVPHYGVMARGVAPLHAVEGNNDDVKESAAAPLWATPVATAALAASLLLSPLPVDARSAPVEPTTTVSTNIASEQKAIAAAKSALDEATTKYYAAMKTVKADQAADSKAQQAVDVAEKNLKKARKSFITANDKLAAARSKRNAALADTEAALVAGSKAAVAKAEADLNSVKEVKINTGKKLAIAQSNAASFNKSISQNKSTIKIEEGKLVSQKEQAKKEKAAKEKAAKNAAERAKKEKKKQKELAKKTAERVKKEKKKQNELAKKKRQVNQALEEKKQKAAAKEKKRIQAAEKAKNDKKNEALAKAEKAKKEEAKRIAAKTEKAKKEEAMRIAESKKKEVKKTEDAIDQLKKVKGEMKLQGKPAKSIQEIESKITNEQAKLLKLKYDK